MDVEALKAVVEEMRGFGSVCEPRDRAAWADRLEAALADHGSPEGVQDDAIRELDEMGLEVAEALSILKAAAPYDCSECGPFVKVDESECCAICGRDAVRRDASPAPEPGGGACPRCASTTVTRLCSECGLERPSEELSAQKDAAYAERDRLVAALSKVWPASLERHPDDDLDWEDDWRWIVFVEAPCGQATWHIHDSELPLFDHLPRETGRKWDGHSTDEKYARLASLALADHLTAPSPQVGGDCPVHHPRPGGMPPPDVGAHPTACTCPQVGGDEAEALAARLDFLMLKQPDKTTCGEAVEAINAVRALGRKLAERAEAAEKDRDAWRAATGLAGMTPEEAGAKIDADDAERDALRERAEATEKLLVDIGHEVLGCDGYPCRVESLAFTAEDVRTMVEADRSMVDDCNALRERVANVATRIENSAGVNSLPYAEWVREALASGEEERDQ